MKIKELKSDEKVSTLRTKVYVSIYGKLWVIFHWILYNRDKTFQEYLDTPIRTINPKPGTKNEEL